MKDLTLQDPLVLWPESIMQLTMNDVDRDIATAGMTLMPVSLRDM